MTIDLQRLKHYIRHFFKARRNGHGVHSPFAYRLCEEVFYNGESFHDFLELDEIREDLLLNEAMLQVQDLGAGSRTFKSSSRKIKDIAAKGISSREQSELLYKLMNFLNCRNAVELGTSLGLNTMYLARVNKNNSIFSIEGSEALYEFAKSLAKKNRISNIHFIHASFEEAFPGVLAKLAQLDFLYVDGNHTYAATVDYFKRALEKRHTNSVFIFDDIYWSKDMTKAWEEIKNHPAVTLSIDTFYFGLLFFKEEIKEKVELRFFL